MAPSCQKFVDRDLMLPLFAKVACCWPQVVVSAFTVVPSRSGAVRTFEQRAVLQQFASRMVAVSLSGYIFFASSVKIQQQVLEVSCQAVQ